VGDDGPIVPVVVSSVGDDGPGVAPVVPCVGDDDPDVGDVVISLGDDGPVVADDAELDGLLVTMIELPVLCVVSKQSN
jgi:hypothetical protein